MTNENHDKPAPSPLPLPADSSSSPAYRVMLPEFEGPLDLLLHLCQTHEIDILNISVAFIAEKYIEYLELMENMAVEVAADYLVMAAHLAYLKSRELVPAPEPLEAAEEGEEPLDPREELIRRLLEYQKYKHAAETLGDRPIEGRNVFVRGAVLQADGEAGLAEHSVWKLIEHWASTLKKAKPEYTHDVVMDRMSISDRINQIVDLLEAGKGMVRFEDLLGQNLAPAELRHKVVVSLLAVLELAKLQVVRILQQESTGAFFLAQVEGAAIEAARRLMVTSAKEEARAETNPTETNAAAEATAEAPAIEAEAGAGAEAEAEAPAIEAATEAPAIETAIEAPASEAAIEAPASEAAAEAPASDSAEDVVATPPSDLVVEDVEAVEQIGAVSEPEDAQRESPQPDGLVVAAATAVDSLPGQEAEAEPPHGDETMPAPTAAPASGGDREAFELRPEEDVFSASFPASAATGEEATDGQTQEEQKTPEK